MGSEAAVQQEIRLAAARLGIHLWRNNSGACTDETGRLIRYGLGNDSAQLNKRIKSPDLVGLTPVVITPDMVGRVVAVFTGVEVKHSDWTHVANDRERAQQVFLDIVGNNGGYSGFANDVHSFMRIVGVKE